VPMVGDADDAHIVKFETEQHGDPYRSLLAIGAVLFERGDFAAKAGRLDDKARWLLGGGAEKIFTDLAAARHVGPPRRSFPDVGYYVLGSDFDTADEVRVLADVGPLGYLSIAAHGHADALAFTLSVGRHEVLVDPGTYTYQGDMAWREYFRGTAAHNTLTVDGMSQSQSGGRFMWLSHGNGRRIRFDEKGTHQELVAEQDGYRRLMDPLIHQREWVYEPAGRNLTVIDLLSSRGAHEVAWFWHFAETVAVSLEPGRVIARVPGWRIEMAVPDGCGAPILLRGSEEPMGGWISRRFEQKTPTSTVSWQARSSGDTSWETRIAVIREAAGV
jgi:Heparinase II/III-like protein